jgi:sensor c-di-GMP phosphodiesterase-like protein
MIWIAIGNAILWSGVILYLLLRLSQNAQSLDGELAALEARIGQEPDEFTP